MLDRDYVDSIYNSNTTIPNSTQPKTPRYHVPYLITHSKPISIISSPHLPSKNHQPHNPKPK
jgi:hypothetical protein